MANRSIAWEMLPDESMQESLNKASMEKLGVELQKLYYDVVIEGDSSALDSELLSSLAEAVETVGETEAEWLSQMYRKGNLPRASHTAEVAASFLSRIGSRFRRALCFELRESRDVALSTRETLVVLAPTIVAIMGLPTQYAALAVPLSIVLAKVSLSAFCEGVTENVEQEAFMQERISLARKAVLYLQHELTRYQNTTPPLALQESLERAEIRLKELETRMGLQKNGQQQLAGD